MGQTCDYVLASHPILWPTRISMWMVVLAKCVLIRRAVPIVTGMSAGVMGEAGVVRLEFSGAVARLILDNPHKRNALTHDMWISLLNHLDEIESRGDCGFVSLESSNAVSFSAGLDRGLLSRRAAEPHFAKESANLTKTVLRRLRNMQIPSAAFVDGFCIGAGLELALECDFRVASANAIFALPVIQLGLRYPEESGRRLVDTVGTGHALMLLLSGYRFTANEALSAGIINYMDQNRDAATISAEFVDRLSDMSADMLIAAKADLGG